MSDLAAATSTSAARRFPPSAPAIEVTAASQSVTTPANNRSTDSSRPR